MSEPTYQDHAPARGDWSQVFTNLDWVERWMADHGYTDAEIAYVVAKPVVPAVAAEVAVAPVEATPVAEVQPAGTAASVWTIPLHAAEPDIAAQAEAAVIEDATDNPESTESVSA